MRNRGRCERYCLKIGNLWIKFQTPAKDQDSHEFDSRKLRGQNFASALASCLSVLDHRNLGKRLVLGWIDGLSIFIAVFIIVTVSSANNYAKEKQFQKLVAKSKEDHVPVFRGREGTTTTINTDDLVVGDVIKLESGSRIPADCIAIEGTDLATDESAMTGEPDQVEKSVVNAKNVHTTPNPFLLANTLIV